MSGQGRIPAGKNLRPVRTLACLLGLGLAAVLWTAPAAAKIGESPQAFAQSPLIHQLQLSFQGQQPVAGTPSRMLHRYVSDDGMITVDLVVRGGTIEQQVMYLPMDMRRSTEVNVFLQDVLGSVVGATQGLLAFRAAVNNRSTTTIRWGGLTVRFAPLNPSVLQILARK